MISILLTSYKEPDTIARSIRSIANKEYSGIPGDFELIQISPDEATLKNGQREADKLGLGDKYRQIVDPHKGKPNALNLGFKEAKGDILILTDGDAYLEQYAVRELLKPFKHKEIGGISGRPSPINTRSKYWGYLSHLFTDAADHKRRSTFDKKRDNYYLGTGKPFMLSGYLFAIRNLNLELPDSVILDDAYISYKVFAEGYQLGYAPDAVVKVKFPTTYRDYIKQRRRNLAGHMDLERHQELQIRQNDRSFTAELKYLLFPIKAARNARELLWSLSVYPLRLLSWLAVLKVRMTKRSIMGKHGWERADSTK